MTTFVPSGPSNGQNSNTLVLNKKSYYEPKYNANAFSIYVPKGWDFQANIIFGTIPVLPFNVDCKITENNGYRGLNFSGIGRLNIWPTESSGPVGQILASMQGQDYYGYFVQPTTSPNDYYNQYINPFNQKEYPKFEVKEIRSNPTKANNLYQSALKDPELGVMISNGMARINYELLELDATFELNGIPMDLYSEYAFQYMLNQNGNMIWGLYLVSSVFAKKGELKQNEPLYRMIMSSSSFNPEWLYKLGIHRAQLANIELDKLEYMRKIQEKVYNDKNAAFDRSMKNYSEAFREISEYQDPFGGDIKMLPNTYDNIWMNANGDVILTDLSLNPNEESEYNQKEWRKVKAQE